jgi:cyclopropane fatty-acyl-phospholipid synthase-like methyltransferase
MDFSNGYEKIAPEFISVRNKSLGISLFREWSKSLDTPSKVLDIGCGDGIPVTQTVIESGHSVFAVDASKSMIRAFTGNFPDVPAKCESVEHSDFFDEEYDGVIAVGIIFLLKESAQLAMIRRVGEILAPGGQFLFSAPIQMGKWNDILTGEESISLGVDKYVQALSSADLQLLRTASDDGNNYYIAKKKSKVRDDKA